MFSVRQGDILIIKVNSLPKEAVKKDTKVLAEGEITGHAHRVSDGDIYGLPNDESRLYLQTYVPTQIIHEEHEEIPIEEPGIYEIRRKKEYNSNNMVRLVVD